MILSSIDAYIVFFGIDVTFERIVLLIITAKLTNHLEGPTDLTQ